MSKSNEKAVTIFERFEVAPALKKQILERDDKFLTRSREEQEELLVFLLGQAEKTLEGVKSRFPIIKVRHAGSKSIELPKVAGQEEAPIVRDFTGIICDQYLTKAYWEGKYGGEGSGSAPDCASVDGLTPYVKEPVNDSCVTCPFNKFGSGVNQDGEPTRGKRCRDQKRVIVKIENNDLPCRMMLSAKNIGPFDTYMNDLQNQGLTIGSVLTRFKAVEGKGSSGQEFTAIDMTTARALSLDEVLELKRKVVEPYGADFRIGAIEANEEGATGPSEQDLKRGTGEKASKVL